MNREEAIGHLRNMKMPHDKFYEETDETNKTLIDKGNEALDMGIKALENQKTGRWIRWYEEVDYKTYTENIPHCKCSVCNKEYDPYASMFIKYCSQCGAKMEGESNE